MGIQEVKIYYQARTVIRLRHRDNSVSDANAEEVAAVWTDLMMLLGKCLYLPPPSSFKMGPCLQFSCTRDMLCVLQHKMMDRGGCEILVCVCRRGMDRVCLGGFVKISFMSTNNYVYK